MGTGATPPLGATLGFFKHFVHLHGGRDVFQGLTTKVVCDRFVRPFTATTHLSLVDHLGLSAKGRDEYVKPASWFVSHAWSYVFLDVIDALDAFFADEGRAGDDIAVWFCMFNNNQHEIRGGVRPFEYWLAQFKGALTAIQNLVMVFSPWNNPTTLTRTWCVFEVFVAIETNARFEVAMGKAQKQSFLSDAGASEHIFTRLLEKIKCANSTTSVPSDRDRIFDLIERGPGFAQVDRIVFHVLEAWADRMVDAEMQAASSNERFKWQVTKAIKLVNKLKHVEAEAFLHAILAGQAKNARYWRATMLLALVQARQKHPRSSWEPLFEAALAHQNDLFGPDHVHVIETKRHFADKLFECGEYTRGLALLQAGVASALRLWGEHHESTVDIMGALGHNLCIYLGRLDDASLWLERTYEASNIVHHGAENHSNIIRSYLMGCYARQGRFSEATALSKETYEQRLRTLGPDSAVTMASFRNLCVGYRFEGNYDKSVEAGLIQCKDFFTACADRSNAAFCTCDFLFIFMNDYVATKVLGDLYLAMGKFKQAKLELDTAQQLLNELDGPTRNRSRTTMYSRLLLACLTDGLNAMETLLAFEVEVIEAGVGGEIWCDVNCHGCYQIIQGNLYMCGDCPRNALRYCLDCVRQGKGELRCAHEPSQSKSWICLSPPIRLLQEKKLEMLAKTNDWPKYTLHLQKYKDYCGKHNVPDEERVEFKLI
ncbi:Aste57867_8588 [Aphanomyces stellatus]|uniref:Aste57867_8588 protein n=1 Tax=Aphanomyces stellatus TaxID=120398 RepID=A0A485KKQ0_9STRA|nr:hypothetical protein As57867_008556 [Aphanomyces stellatus]VFT85474.1 Aste57867_8588 [Aphanomyces stellatus]